MRILAEMARCARDRTRHCLGLGGVHSASHTFPPVGFGTERGQTEEWDCRRHKATLKGPPLFGATPIITQQLRSDTSFARGLGCREQDNRLMFRSEALRDFLSWVPTARRATKGGEGGIDFGSTKREWKDSRGPGWRHDGRCGNRRCPGAAPSADLQLAR